MIARIATASPRMLDHRGFGLIELMATVALIAILAAMGLTSFDSRRQDLNTAVRTVTADVRWARARAIVAGEHLRFYRTGDNTYEIERLEEVDGVWQTNAVVRRGTLPDHVALDTGVSDDVEIDSRGTLVFADAADTAPLTWTLTDSHFSASRTLTLYPSGQIDAAQ